MERSRPSSINPAATKRHAVAPLGLRTWGRAPTCKHGPHVSELSVGTRVRRAVDSQRLPSDELLHKLQRQSACGYRAPVVLVAGPSGAVRPAIFVHRQGIVRFGALMFRTSAVEVDDVVHHSD